MIMRKSVICAVSAGLIISMIGGYTVMANQRAAKEIPAEKESTAPEADTSVVSEFLSDNVVDKQETVYVIAKADGSVEKVIVSELLNNNDKADTITDSSNLSNIVNTKNDAAYTMQGDALVWEAEGDAVYYRGDSENEVPVSFNITFKLDGKTVSADEIAGKSGKLEMSFNYKNNLSRTVIIDGKETEIYVPFVMLSGMIVDNEVFKHISVDNGKVIDDGDKSIIVGVALPGMNSNLGFENTIFPESFTVTADVKDFRLTTTLTLATNDVFNHFGFDGLTDTSDIETMIATLTQSVKSLADGTAELYNGLDTLSTKVSELVSGIGTLTQAAKELQNGLSKLDVGLNTIDSKLIELSTGLTKLSENSANLNEGSKKVFNTLLAQTQARIAASGIENYGIKVPALTIENYSAELTKLSQTLKNAGMPTESIDGAKTSLDEYNTFYQGLATYTAGVDSAAAGSTAIESAFNKEILGGGKKLADSLAEFATGITTLNEKMPELVTGLEKLTAGSKIIADGMGQLYTEAIEKVLAEIDNVSEFITRIETVLDVSAAYVSYGGISEDMTGTTKFIYTTGNISK